MRSDGRNEHNRNVQGTSGGSSIADLERELQNLRIEVAELRAERDEQRATQATPTVGSRVRLVRGHQGHYVGTIIRETPQRFVIDVDNVTESAYRAKHNVRPIDNGNPNRGQRHTHAARRNRTNVNAQHADAVPDATDSNNRYD